MEDCHVGWDDPTTGRRLRWENRYDAAYRLSMLVAFHPYSLLPREQYDSVSAQRKIVVERKNRGR